MKRLSSRLWFLQVFHLALLKERWLKLNLGKIYLMFFRLLGQKYLKRYIIFDLDQSSQYNNTYSVHALHSRSLSILS